MLLRLGAFLIIILHANGIFSQDSVLVEKVKRNPYYKNILINNEQDKITYYLSEFDKEKALPLIVYIQGSGYHSLFSKTKQSVIPTSGHIDLTYLAKGKAKVLIIEKPGVYFLDIMSPNARNEEFDQRFSLESWSERIQTVINKVLNTEKIDTSKIMLMGHSEGGIVAARVAKLMPKKITNVCIMAGEGPSQFYSIYSFAKSGIFFSDISSNSKERIDYFLKIWDDIMKNPTSTKKFFWGFTYLRWASFLRTSVIDELIGFDGTILVLQGEEDRHVNPEAAKVLFTSLLSKGHAIQLVTIEGADHSFLEKNSDVNGWKQAMNIALNWFL